MKARVLQTIMSWNFTLSGEWSPWFLCKISANPFRGFRGDASQTDRQTQTANLIAAPHSNGREVYNQQSDCDYYAAVCIYCCCSRYDPQTNQWSSDVAPTSSCRTSVGVAVLDNHLYAVGGQDGVSCLSYVEKSAFIFLLFVCQELWTDFYMHMCQNIHCVSKNRIPMISITKLCQFITFSNYFRQRETLFNSQLIMVKFLNWLRTSYMVQLTNQQLRVHSFTHLRQSQPSVP